MDNKTTSGGIGLCGLLTVLFVALKLIGYISWSWLWVLSPLWLPPVVIIAVVLLVCIIVWTLDEL